MTDRCKNCGEGWWVNNVCQMCNNVGVIDVNAERESDAWGR